MFKKRKSLFYTLSLCLLLTSCFNKGEETVRTNIKVVTDKEVITDLKANQHPRISKQMVEEDFENLMKTNSGFYYCKRKNKCILVLGRRRIKEPVTTTKPLLAIAPVELYDFKNNEMYFGEAQFIEMFGESGLRTDIDCDFRIEDGVVQDIKYNGLVYRPVYLNEKYLEYNVDHNMYENHWIEYGEYIPIQQRLRTSDTYTDEFEELMKPIFFEKYLKFEELRAKNMITDKIHEALTEYENSQQV